MKIGADGSFSRIIGSVKDYVTGLKIIKTPDDQLKESEPFYKLVFVNKADESSSEKSDEEMFDEEIIHTENLYENKESEKVYNECDMNKPESKTVQEENNNSGYQKLYHRNHNKFFERKNPSRTHQSFHHNQNDEKSYKNYNSAKRNSTTSSSLYNQHAIDPWILPQPNALGPSANFGYANYAYQNVMPEPVRQVPVSSEKPVIRKGLLGDKPAAVGIPNFPLNGHYIQNQASHFPPPALNFPANDPNRWTLYTDNYVNYQRPVPDASIPVSLHRNNHFRRKRKWNHKQKQKDKNWERNQPKSSNVRRNLDNQFKYGN